jgi:hypothetical protein
LEKDKEQAVFYRKRIFLIFTIFSAFGAVIGAAGAYLYYLFVGCATGTCPITSNPWLISLWGAVMGYLIGDIMSPGNTRKKTE